VAEKSASTAGTGPSHRAVEIGVAIATVVFAAIVIGGSLQVGINWAADGPRAGFFPFYIALFILISGIVNLYHSALLPTGSRLFAEWGQLGQVLSVVIPSAIYVALVPWLGIYAASAILIAVFMKWIGRYGWALVISISILMPVITFVVFEKWFLVPLPKGPIEEFLGF
jgi:hypothetical protein